MDKPIELVLGHLRGVKQSGQEFTALCPAHEDHNNSLSVCAGDDDRALLHCHAGCSVHAIVEALGLTVQDLFLNTRQVSSVTTRPSQITVEDLARDKQLPIEFLRSLGLEDRDDGVLIPYFNKDGNRAQRHRLRTALAAKDGSLWLFGRGKPVPYGLNRLQDARDAGYLIIVEGESDCWTLWHHNLPALGIPGAGMTEKLQAEHVKAVERVVVIQEPDQGGERFVEGIGTRLATLRWKGKAEVVRLIDAKDPNELHRRDEEGFAEAFANALQQATPLRMSENSETDVPTQQDGDTAELLVGSGIAALDSDASPQALEQALRQLAARLRDSDPLHRVIARTAVISHMEAVGIRAPSKLVDAALGTHVPGGDPDDLQGQHLALSDPDPWPDPVDGPSLLDEIASFISRVIALPAGAADAVALWIIHCYTIGAAFASPILTISSPEKRCGKTTLLEIIAALASRAVLASNITTAALFRTIEKYKPTLLVDEADTFMAQHEEMRGVINAGHTRNSARVIRTVGDQNEPRVFSTWCPKAIALIGKLPSTIEDRSIVIRMRRRAPDEQLERIRRDRIHQELEPYRRRAARWSRDQFDALRDADPEMPQELHDRAQDNWRPLLAIADTVGQDWPRRAREAAILLTTGQDEAELSAKIQLLSDLRDLFRDRNTDHLTTDEVLAHLTGMEDRPWPEWRKGKPLSAVQLARLLKPFGARPQQFRQGDGKARGYVLEELLDCFGRYLPPDPVHPVHLEKGAEFRGKGVPGRSEQPGTNSTQPGTDTDGADGCTGSDPVRTGSCTGSDVPKNPNVPGVPAQVPTPKQQAQGSLFDPETGPDGREEFEL